MKGVEGLKGSGDLGACIFGVLFSAFRALGAFGPKSAGGGDSVEVFGFRALLRCGCLLMVYGSSLVYSGRFEFLSFSIRLKLSIVVVCSLMILRYVEAVQVLRLCIIRLPKP